MAPGSAPTAAPAAPSSIRLPAALSPKCPTRTRATRTGPGAPPHGRSGGTIVNPATGGAIAEVPYADASDVDRAVRAAHDAFLKWREVPVVDRVQVLYRFKALLEKHQGDLAATLT